jgi:8-oxo-dGTP diphosphatase
VRVVAAAIVRDGRVLAARRCGPAALAGGWEFPGGKVEDGESDVDALSREINEELGVDVRVRRRLGEATEGDVHLVLHLATLRRRGDPQAGADHDELRWLDAETLGAVDWLPVDRVLLPSVLDHLS